MTMNGLSIGQDVLNRNVATPQCFLRSLTTRSEGAEDKCSDVSVSLSARSGGCRLPRLISLCSFVGCQKVAGWVGVLCVTSHGVRARWYLPPAPFRPLHHLVWSFSH